MKLDDLLYLLRTPDPIPDPPPNPPPTPPEKPGGGRY